MLNVRALNNVLSQNADNKLFLRWFIMTPNGSLIAYTVPANMKELRDQVALVSISWKEQIELKDSQLAANDSSPYSPPSDSHSDTSTSPPDLLETLTIEFDNRNLVVKYLEPKLLLVLEGGVPPGRRKPLKVTAEGRGDARYPPDDDVDWPDGGHNAPVSSSLGSKVSISDSTASLRRLSVLQIQRKKTEIMARTIKEELQRSGFQMPEDPTNKFF